jgi:hypothetical protein
MEKKISIVSDQYYPSSTAQAIRIKYFSEAMADDPSLSVQVFTSKHSSDNGKIKVIKNLISPPSNTSSNAVRLLFELLYGIELFIRLVFYRHDLVIITSPPFFVATIAALYCKVFSVKYIMDVRDDYPQQCH